MGKVLNGETLEMPARSISERPARMYQFMRQTTKPCFAFKIMAGPDRGGRSGHAFRLAFSSIKPNDGIFIGLFPRVSDEVRRTPSVFTHPDVLSGASG